VHGHKARVVAYALIAAAVAASPFAATQSRPAHMPPAAQIDAASPTTPAPRREGAPECKVGTERISPMTGRKQVCK